MKAFKLYLIWALAIGMAALLGYQVFVPTIFYADDRAKASRTHNDLRTIVIALESYRIDHDAYPPPAPSTSGWTRLPPNLTTPTAHIPHLPQGPFLPEGETYGYALVADNPTAWSDIPNRMGFSPVFVLLSPGPTRQLGPFRIDINTLYDPTNGTQSPGTIAYFGGEATMEEIAQSGTFLPNHAADAKPHTFTYEPTNGTITRCPVWRVKQ